MKKPTTFYKLSDDSSCLSDSGSSLSYGIDCVSSDEENNVSIIDQIKNISPNKEFIEKVVYKLNKFNVYPEHMQDVLDDETWLENEKGENNEKS